MKAFTWKTMKPAAALLPLLMAAGLTACGGGGDGDDSGDPSANNAPVVDAGDARTVLARSDVTLEASATDADGSVASYAWTQTAGTAVTLSATDDAFAEFTAPAVSAAETLTFELTVTDDEGATAKDTVSITVHPAVAMSAKVYDGPLAGATVTVTVGDQTYTAVTGADGAFELNIGSPDPGTMITIVATGGAGQEFVELVSIAGTFGALMNAAGDNGVLDATESGAVDVTNLSTAKAVLMLEANGGTPPADDDALTDLEKSLDVDAMVELATVIKLVIDEGVALPDGVESTYDLVGDSSAIDTVIETAEAGEAGIFESTMNEMLADPNLTPSFEAEDFPGVYFVNRAGSYVTSNRGFTVDLQAGGVGYIYGAGPSVSAAMTWALEDDGSLHIAIDETDPFVTTGTCGTVTCNVTVTALDFALVTDGALVDTVSMARTGTVEYPFNPEIPTAAISGSSLHLAMETHALEPFVAADVHGTWSVPLSNPNTDFPVGDEYETGLLTFNTDGTGTRPADGEAFAWSIDADGVLNIAFSGGDVLDLYWLRDEGELAMDVMAVMITADEDAYTLAHLVVTNVNESYAAGLTLADFDGEWHYTDWNGLNYVIDSLAGSATSTFYNADGGIAAAYPAGASYTAGELEVISWIDVVGPPPNPSISDCADASGNCFYSYSSTWRPLVEDSSGRIFMLEQDRAWAYDDTNMVDFRGALTYRHGTNRWLLKSEAMAAMAGEGLFKTSARRDTIRGDLVRDLLGGTMRASRR